MMQVRLIQGENRIDIVTSDIAHFAAIAFQNSNLTIILNPQIDNQTIKSYHGNGRVKLNYVGFQKPNDRLAAIRTVRNATTLTLTESKDFLDTMSGLGNCIEIENGDANEIIEVLEQAGYYFRVAS